MLSSWKKSPGKELTELKVIVPAVAVPTFVRPVSLSSLFST